MKKLLAIFAAFIMAFPGIGWALEAPPMEDEVLGEASPADAEPLKAPPMDNEEPMSLTVGVKTKMSGYLFTRKWGTNTTDMDLRELVHGHNTVAWEQSGNCKVNQTVVKDLGEYMRGDDKAYRITLHEGLAYSDGTPITARDYVFSALLLSSNEFAALGGAPTEMSFLAGYDRYRQGLPFSGVGMIGKNTFELTLDGNFLPYFYEIALLNLIPYPIEVLAPGCEVRDDGGGAYIDGTFTSIDEKLAEMRENSALAHVDEAFLRELMQKIQTDGSGAYPHGLFCEELLRETVLKEETGYLRYPTTTTGPFMLQSIDVENQIAQFVKNPYYTGNFEGVIPKIDEITVVFCDPETALDDIEDGTIDLISKVSDGLVIAEGEARIEDGLMRAVNYLRTGLNFISFACELGPTQSVNVRKAVAYCVDRHTINAEFTQGYGVPVYGYYGLGQWMALQSQDALAEYETQPDLDTAARYLAADGWTLAETGEAYHEEIGGVRCRTDENGMLERLSLKWAQSEETAMSALLEEMIRAKLEAIGIELTIVKMPFNELLAHYYRQTDREYNIISLGTDFMLAFDPYYTFHTGELYQGEANKTGLTDEDLMNLTVAMRRTNPGDRETYLERWLNFQRRFVELQPMVPLYSNIYFDFFRPDLQQYRANAYFSWATAIVYSYIGDAPDWAESAVGNK